MKKQRQKSTEENVKDSFEDDRYPVGHLSASSVGMYLRCAKQFEFRYVEGLKNPPEIVMIEGSCAHTAYEKNNNHKIKHGTDMHNQTMFELFADEFIDNTKNIPKHFWDDDDTDTIINRHKQLIEMYLDKFAPDIHPIHAERKFRIKINDIPILGFIDLEENNRLSDYKTSKRKKSRTEALNSLQLALYSIARKKTCVRFISLCKTAAPKVETSTVFLGDEHIDWAKKVITSAAEGIRAGNFPYCHPESFTCHKKYCGYYRICRGKKDEND